MYWILEGVSDVLLCIELESVCFRYSIKHWTWECLFQVFFYKMDYRGGNINLGNEAAISDYVWVTTDELPKYLSKSYLQCLEKFIICMWIKSSLSLRITMFETTLAWIVWSHQRVILVFERFFVDLQICYIPYGFQDWRCSAYKPKDVAVHPSKTVG